MTNTAYMTVAEFQREFNISKNTAYQLVHREDFPAIKIGRTIRIPRQALDDWVAKQVGGKTGHEE